MVVLGVFELLRSRILNGCGWIDIRVCWSDSGWVVASSDGPAFHECLGARDCLKLGG